MKERPRKWFHETTELALSLTPYIAPDDTDIKDRRVFAGICQPQRFHRGSHAQARRFRLAPQCHVVSIGNMPRPFRRPSEEAQRMVTTGAPTSVRRSGLGWRSRSQMSAIVRTISPVVASTISTDQVSCQDLVETCQRPESAARPYERARPSCARISVGVLPVHRLNACVKALTS